VLVKGLQDLGSISRYRKATFYVWVPVEDCMAFAGRLLQETGIVATRVSVSGRAARATCGLPSRDRLRGYRKRGRTDARGMGL